jgi:hypothetical protein
VALPNIFRRIYRYLFSKGKLTLHDLAVGTGRVGHNQGTVKGFRIQKSIPLINTKSFVVDAIALVQTTHPTNAKSYHITMAFYDVDFNTSKSTQFPVQLKLPGTGNVVYMEKLKIRTHNVAVRCDCYDYWMTYSYYNEKEKALYGPSFPKYTKVPGSKRGPRNPVKSPGACKHIWQFVTYLKSINYLE